MATALPPAANELLDGAAITWAVGAGYLHWQLDNPIALDPRRLLTRGELETTVRMEPMGGSGIGATQLLNWTQILAWREQGPLTGAAPQSWTVAGGGLPGGGVQLTWTNPAGTHTSWSIRIYRRTGGCGPTGWALLTTISFGGGLTTGHRDTTTSAGTLYGYRAEYTKGARVSASTDCGSATAVAPQEPD